MESEADEVPPVVIDWKQLLVYLMLGLGLVLIARELIEIGAAAVGIENIGRGRRTLFSALALLIGLLATRLAVKLLRFMPDKPARPTEP